jgi:hypothetical protein
MIAGTSALLIAIGGGAAGIAALTSHHDGPKIVTAVGQPATAVPPDAVQGLRPAPARPGHPGTHGTAAEAPPLSTRADAQADRSATRTPRRGEVPAPVTAGGAAAAPAPADAAGAAPAGPASAHAATTTRTDVETREIPFPTRLVRDPSLPRGTKQVRSAGVPGVQTTRYLVTLLDGRPTDRRLLDTAVTRPPQPRVIAFGTGRPAGGPPNGRPGWYSGGGSPDGTGQPGGSGQVNGDDQGSGQVNGGGRHGSGQWNGRGHGRFDGRPGRGRECGRPLHLCVPLGRSAICPDAADRAGSAAAVPPAGPQTTSPGVSPAGRPAAPPAGPPAASPAEESTLQLGGSVVVAGQDVELLGGDTLGDLGGLHC